MARARRCSGVLPRHVATVSALLSPFRLQLFLHQTQYKDGILAGRYAYVKIRAVTAQGSTCVVALTAPLNTPFRSGTGWADCGVLRLSFCSHWLV